MSKTTDIKVTPSTPTKDAAVTLKANADDVNRYAAAKTHEANYTFGSDVSFIQIGPSGCSPQAFGAALSLVAADLKSPLLLKTAEAANTGKLTPMGNALLRYSKDLGLEV